MNKIIIAMISIIIIFSAIFLAISIYSPNEVENEDNIIANIANQDKVTDECVEEYEQLNNENIEEVINTNSNEIKISPNCSFTLKKYYKQCEHVVNEYLSLPDNLINNTKEELQKKYKDWTIETFESNKVVLYKEFEGECNEHYVLKQLNGKIVIYKIDSSNAETLYEETEISTDYLTDEDKLQIENGIKVYGKEALNQAIEDFE